MNVRPIHIVKKPAVAGFFYDVGTCVLASTVMYATASHWHINNDSICETQMATCKRLHLVIALFHANTSLGNSIAQRSIMTLA